MEKTLTTILLYYPSPGEGRGCPPQYSRASLVAQMVKNLPAMRETWVPSLGWEDSLEEAMATHCSVPTWRVPKDGDACVTDYHKHSCLKQYKFSLS